MSCNRIWRVPDRQCVARATSRDIIYMQPDENVLIGFDWSELLDRLNATISIIVNVDDGMTGFLVPGSEAINGKVVEIRVATPLGTPTAEHFFEATILDSNSNRHLADGRLRVLEA